MEKSILESIVLTLFNCKCILFNEFKLSSGITSPYYIDLRIIPSYPEAYDIISNAYVNKIKELNIRFDKICGIAVSGLPLAALVAYKLKKPFIYARKEKKEYGTKSLIEGVINKNDKILILDDVITTGGNIITTVNALREIDAIVEKAIVLVDREQGGFEKLKEMNVELISIIKVSQIFKILFDKELISKEKYEEILKYTSENLKII
ncbi:MAG: orotate phosphoribosyltransferase [Nitrososphaerota archaeon]